MFAKFLKQLLTPDLITSPTNNKQHKRKQYKRRNRLVNLSSLWKTWCERVTWTGSVRRSGLAGLPGASPRRFSPQNIVASRLPFGAYLTRGLVLSSSPHSWALYFLTSAMYFDQASLLPGSASVSCFCFFATMPVFRNTPPLRFPTWVRG